MFWSKLCKSRWNNAWNLAFPVLISPLVWNMCENLYYESVYFKELHNQQEYYWRTIYKTGAAVVSTITSHIERYIDRYILLFSCTCARVHFSLVIVQLVKHSVQRQIFSSSGFLFQFAKNMSFMHAPCETNFAMANYIADFGNEWNIPRSSRSASYTASTNW